MTLRTDLGLWERTTTAARVEEMPRNDFVQVAVDEALERRSRDEAFAARLRRRAEADAAARGRSRGETAATTLRIARTRWGRVSAAAQEDGLSITSFIQLALEQALEARASDPEFQVRLRTRAAADAAAYARLKPGHGLDLRPVEPAHACAGERRQ